MQVKESPEHLLRAFDSNFSAPAMGQEVEMFQEAPQAEVGYLYRVQVVGPVFEVTSGSYWEVDACQAVTQSGLSGLMLEEYILDCGRKFWTNVPHPRCAPNAEQFFLCEQGAIIVALERQVTPKEVNK